MARSADLGIIQGKRRRKVIYGKTRKEVADKLKALHRDQVAGINIAPEQQTVQQFDGRFQRVEPKTASSVRTLPLPATLLRMLQAHRIAQHEERALRGEAWKDQGLVFPSNVGTPISPRNLVRHFKTVLKRAGLPETTRFHDLRHSCATLLIAQGVHPRVVMEILGHSQISVTMNTYGHVLPETQREAADKIDALFPERNHEPPETEDSTPE